MILSPPPRDREFSAISWAKWFANLFEARKGDVAQDFSAKNLNVTGTTTLATSLTGTLRADAGVVSVGHVFMTPWASTSGVSNTWSGVPSWATEILVMLNGVALSGVDTILVQLGDAGGVESSGYLSCLSLIDTAASSGNRTDGFYVGITNSGANVIHGTLVFRKTSESSFAWIHNGNLGRSDAAQSSLSAGSKALSDTLTQLKILTAGGVVTFDAGLINVAYR